MNDTDNGTFITTTRGIYAAYAPSLALLSSSPTNGAINIPTNVVFELTFSAPLDKSTVPENIVLEKTGFQSVVTEAMDYSDGTITFHAIPSLYKDTQYTIRIKTGLKSVNGRSFGKEKTISFTTEALSPPTNLHQQVQSPGLEVREVVPGEKI